IVLASHDTATLELATSTIRIAGPAGRARTPAEAPPETPSPSVPAGAARDRGAGRGADAGPDGDAAGPRGSAAGETAGPPPTPPATGGCASVRSCARAVGCGRGPSVCRCSPPRWA